MKATTVSVSIDRAPADVYAFAANPENLPRWAAGLCLSVRRADREWIVETPQGPMGFRFAPSNDLGVLDHYVSPSPGVEFLNPMRVVPNGAGSEVLFTVFQPPDASDEAFAQDVRLVARDLGTLKRLLEG
ncbi:MAG: SRPBCC family protein [Candidatus Rokubacteria bacterium]|nr:SRPBCC family protein [Candidatus Rokubacteria bacterium]